jgi:glycosyltransferase involved in cell wall biosynthesis
VHAVQVSFYLDPQRREPLQLLHDWPSLADVAEAVSGAGARVSVIQACSRTEILTREGVDYYFLAPDPGVPTIVRSPRFGELICRLAPDVFHVHGFGFPRDVLALAGLAPGIPIMLQDHANGPPPMWRRSLWRLGFAAASGLAITGTAKLECFRSAGLVHPRLALFDIPESSSRFHPGDRADARRATGLDGEPCLLWVGHLNRNKDPLAVLDGVSRAARQMSGLKLWCCFGSAPQLSAVEHRIARDPLLSPRVQLLGTVSHSRIEQLMRAADVFVLGSHSEGSGYAVLEALACGLPPAVTDIPAFRSLIGTDGAVGHLWPCGNAGLLSDAIVSIASRSQPPLRSAVRAHFDRELSFDAVGRKLTAAYEQLLARQDVTAAGSWATNLM